MNILTRAAILSAAALAFAPATAFAQNNADTAYDTTTTNTQYTTVEKEDDDFPWGLLGLLGLAGLLGLRRRPDTIRTDTTRDRL